MIDEIIFRCSTVGKLMGAKGLGVTGQTLAIEAYIEHVYGRTKDINSKYLERGITSEQNGINLFNELSGEQYVKNEERKSNEFIIGEPDLIGEDIVIDIKSSWDIYTFFKAKSEFNSIYEWQLRGYMELFNKQNSTLVYTLTDAVDDFILDALHKESYKWPKGEISEWKEVEIVKNMVYDRENFKTWIDKRNWQGDDEISEGLIRTFVHIEPKDRIFTYSFERDKAKTELMYKRIGEARTFLKTIF
jgi:hypothetical protein